MNHQLREGIHCHCGKVHRRGYVVKVGPFDSVAHAEAAARRISDDAADYNERHDLDPGIAVSVEAEWVA